MLERRTPAAASLLAAVLLGACGAADTSAVIGTGRWGSIDVSVESRPAPPRAGNNEVVVSVTGERRQPIYDALVFLRAGDDAPWVQAIEDGHVGVYRRAVNFGAGGRAVVQLRLRRGADETTLQFPIAVLAGP
jgi:hypothetical protein